MESVLAAWRNAAEVDAAGTLLRALPVKREKKLGAVLSYLGASGSSNKTLDSSVRWERSGAFRLHAVCPHSSHHMQVMTAVKISAPHPQPSFQRKLEPSVFYSKLKLITNT